MGTSLMSWAANTAWRNSASSRRSPGSAYLLLHQSSRQSVPGRYLVARLAAAHQVLAGVAQLDRLRLQ